MLPSRAFVDALRAVWQRVDPCVSVGGRFKTERPARVVEEETLPPVDVTIDVMKPFIDLPHDRFGERTRPGCCSSEMLLIFLLDNAAGRSMPPAVHCMKADARGHYPCHATSGTTGIV